MNKLSSFALVLILLLTGCQPNLSKSVAGYWEGAINLPGMDMKINVDLAADPAGVWAGKIAIPVQGVRAMPLQNVAVTPEAIRFIMPGVPGQPSFTGKLASDGKTISGDFTQNNQKFTFKLEKKTRPVETSAETPEEGVPGKGLAGFWQGSLKPSPLSELRLFLEITKAEGKLAGTMISVDQGNAKIPLSNVEEDGAIHFDATSVGGAFFGDMGTNGAEFSGQWTQMGRGTQIVFKRLSKAPAAAK